MFFEIIRWTCNDSDASVKNPKWTLTSTSFPAQWYALFPKGFGFSGFTETLCTGIYEDVPYEVAQWFIAKGFPLIEGNCGCTECYLRINGPDETIDWTQVRDPEL